MTVKSDRFEANENKHQTVFTGHVNVKKEQDTIDSNSLTVFFDNDNKPIKYTAQDDVKLSITLKNSTIKGSAKTLEFVPKSKVYTLTHDVKLTQLPSQRKIQATKVIIDTKNDKITITGQDKDPAVFIFNIEENK
jgi:lipopolysaccharide export system protein LptA